MTGTLYFTGAHHDCGTVFIGAHHDCGTLFILQGYTMTVEQSIYFTGACCDCGIIYFTGARHDCGAMLVLQGHAMTVEQCLFYRGMRWLWNDTQGESHALKQTADPNESSSTMTSSTTVLWDFPASTWWRCRPDSFTISHFECRWPSFRRMFILQNTSRTARSASLYLYMPLILREKF